MKFLSPTPQTAPSYIGEYKILNEIGFGSTGVVKLAEDQTGRRFAVKIIPSLNPQQRNEALREIEILNRLRHENIIQVKHFQDTKDHIYIVTEYLDSGDLYLYMLKYGTFTEAQALPLFRQMVSALEFCHRNSICHHDFKLENCVVHSDGSLRLIDFAYAMDFSDPSTPIRSYHGSPAYAAPEVLFHQPHDASVDIYSLGTCLYYMLCGSFPFVKDETTTTFEQLCRNVKAFQLDFPPHLSEDVIDLLSRMITKKDRISWHEIATHPWVLGCTLMDFDSGNRMSL